MFGTHNAAFVQVMYEAYLRDPASVGEDWRQLFENGRPGDLPIIPTYRAELAGSGKGEAGSVGVVAGPPPASPIPSPGLAPIRGPAARLAQNMADSLTVPTATSFRDVEVETLAERRRQMNAALAARGMKISFTHLIGFAIVQAAHQFPVMTHAFVEVDGQPQRMDPAAVNLGLAVDVEKKDGSRALVVPVIKQAEAMDFAGFHATYETLVEKARTNRLVPDDFAGATITLTNPGTLGTVASVPRLMKGQGSIIATGAIRDYGGGAGKFMTITSTYDHRIIQGAESGMFLRRLDALLQGEERFYEQIFESLGLKTGSREQGAVPSVAAPAPRAPLPAPDELKHVAAAMALVKAHRHFGHLGARLDPLGSEPPGDPALDPGPLGLSPEIMARIPAEVLRIYVPGRTLAEALPALQATYCGTIAYEVEHIGSHQERVWLRQVIESGEHKQPLSADEKQELLARLTAVDALERFLHKAYLGQKRFSIEGLDITVPMLDLSVELAGAAGARDVVIGMAHRGRLNVLAHVVGLPYETIFAEFEGGRHVEETLTPEGGTGDVKYHHGAEGVHRTASGKPVTVTLSPNPSHLEAVNPVVEGRARAEQTTRRGPEAHHDPTAALPVLIHGDAAFAAQGVVAETFNLARLRGYTTGGTIHLIANNQVGFTTDPKEARSTDYASDLAKGFDVPIIHVNADDPEACLAAVRLAMMYRDKFHGDVVIDVVGYRRHGHNEGDEPAYTQPLMYERIKRVAPVRERYAEQLAREGVVQATQAAAQAEAAYQRLAEIQQSLKASLSKEARGEEPQRISGAFQAVPEPETAVSAELLASLNEALLSWPEGFTVNPKLKKQLERRRSALGPEGAGGGDRVGPCRGARARHPAHRGGPDPRHRPRHRARYLQPATPRAARRRDRPAVRADPAPAGRARAVRAPQQPALGAGVPGLRVRLRGRGARDAGAVGGAIRGFRQQRRSDRRPVHHRGTRQVGSDLPAHRAVAARLRGPGPRALERAARALPRARRRGKHPGRQLHDSGPVLPPAAPPGAPRRAAAPRCDDAEEPAAPAGGELATRGPHQRPVPSGTG